MSADPRFFIDEDLIGLGKLLTARHEGITWPGHRLIPAVPRKTKDRDWLPIIGERGLVVISRDRHLRTQLRYSGDPLAESEQTPGQR